MVKLKVNPGIMQIEPYVQGKSKVAGKTKIIKLSSNEAAFGPSPKAVAAYKNYTPLLHRYNEGSCFELRQALAKKYKIEAENIVCGAGSDELIALITTAYASTNDEIIYSEHGFLMYPISAMRAGAKPIKAPEKNLRADINFILKKVTKKTRIVFIANPNNPTGSYISAAEILQLRKKLPQNILLVIDAAYAEFVSEKDYTDGIDIVQKFSNVVMLRTFSKIYGLAALRLGWCYASPEIADVLHRVRGPFNVSGPAQAAGIAALNDSAFTRKNILHNNKWLKIYNTKLKQLGFLPHPSVANFVLVEFPGGKKQAQLADEKLKSHGIIVRKMDAYNLPDCLRITIGTAAENQAVLAALAEIK